MVRYFALAYLFCFSFHSHAQLTWSDYPLGVPLTLETTEGIISLQSSDKNAWVCSVLDQKGNEKKAINLTLNENEILADFSAENGKAYLLTQVAKPTEQSAALYLRTIDLIESKISEANKIWEQKVGLWKNGEGKARIVNDLKIQMASLRSYGTEQALEFRFQIAHSKASTKHLVSFMHHDKSKLEMSVKIFDQNWQSIDSRTIGFDNDKWHYAHFINDLGDIFLLNGDASGAIEMLRFPFKSEDFQFLNITAGNAQRDDFQAVFLDDLKVFVVAKVEIDDLLHGVLYAKFDFNVPEVDRIHFEPLSLDIKDVSDSLQGQGLRLASDWRHFTIAHVSIHNDEELLIGLEYQTLEYSGFVYRDISFHNPSGWEAHKSQSIFGPLLVYQFDKFDELHWEQYFYKSTKSSPDNDVNLQYFVIENPKNERLGITFESEGLSTRFELDYIYNATKLEKKTLDKGYYFYNRVLEYSDKTYLGWIPNSKDKITIKALGQ